MKFESFNEEYVRRLTAGDSGVEEHFALYFGDLLFLKLRVRLRSVELIEDVRQETLARVLQVLRQGAGVKCPERFGAFVNGVCNNVLRETCRLEGREEPWDDSMEEPVDSSIDLDAELVTAESQRVIRRIFAQMPEKDRLILKAVYLDEIEKREICRRFKVDPGYLRVLLHRAKAQFREAYGQCRDESYSAWPPACPAPVNPVEVLR